MLNSKNFVLTNTEDWFLVNDGMRRQILGYNDQIMMVKIEFKAGVIGYAHSHIHSQCSYVVSGVFEFQIGENTKTVKAGDGLYMEPNVIHGVKCLEDGILIDTFSPVREDFL